MGFGIIVCNIRHPEPDSELDFKPISSLALVNQKPEKSTY